MVAANNSCDGLDFLGTRGDCCIIILAVARGVVKLSAQISIGDVVVVLAIHSFVLLASSSSSSHSCMYVILTAGWS